METGKQKWIDKAQTQNGKVARETIRQDVGGTVLKTETLDFFYDESG